MEEEEEEEGKSTPTLEPWIHPLLHAKIHYHFRVHRLSCVMLTWRMCWWFINFVPTYSLQWKMC